VGGEDGRDLQEYFIHLSSLSLIVLLYIEFERCLIIAIVAAHGFAGNAASVPSVFRLPRDWTTFTVL